MDSNIFTVSSYHDLLVMQRVFREAKFCLSPSDDEISASPIVADLFSKLMESLIAAETAIKGESARERWTQWLTIDESREEWGVAIQRAKCIGEWSSWSHNQRVEYAKDLLNPFIVPAELLQRFVESV